MADISIGLHFGALADSIADQLKQQKVLFDKEVVALFQKQADALMLLKFHSIIPETASKKAVAKLYANIMKHVAKQNKMRVVKPAK